LIQNVDIGDRDFYTWRSRTVRLFLLRIAAESTSLRGKEDSVNVSYPKQKCEEPA
jgi:hypothetical protein